MVEEKIGSKGQCPSCRREVSLRGWLRVKPIYGNQPPESSLKNRAIISSNGFECPHCGAILRARYEIRLMELVDPAGAKTVFSSDSGAQTHKLPKLSTAEEEILRICKEKGVMRSFEEAYGIQTGNDVRPPSGIDRFFTNFLRTAERCMVERDLLAQFVRDFDRGRIECWRSQGIIMVTSNGEIVMFVSQKAINLRKDKAEKPKLYGVQVVSGQRAWGNIIKTRVGYVPSGSGVHLAALLDFNGKASRQPTRPQIQDSNNNHPGRLVRKK